MNHEALVDAVVALAQAAGGDVGPEELLQHLVDVAAEHLAVDGAGVMINDGELLRFVHSSSSAVDGAERLQELTQEGPCHDALLSRAEVVVDDLADPAQTAWPEYVQRAREAGFESVVAVPLVGRGRVWGALDLYRHRAGTWQPAELQWVRLLAHVAVSYVVMASERDQARRAQSELAHRSTHDALTGLPNRALLFDRLEHALAAARRHQRTVAVFFIDLDRFKAVNDTFGHAAGDTVLATVATRVSATLRHEDTLARLAGDEFVLICEDLPQAEPDELAEHVQAVITRLRRVLAQPVRIGELDLAVSASIGVALSEDHPGADELLADADAAMYRAKHHTRDAPGGGGTIDLTVAGGTATGGTAGPPAGTAAGPHAWRSVRHLERQLAQALPHEQLRVHYQPITDASGAVHAVEALLRWQHPAHGLLPAGRFIDLAAGNGTIVGIGRWVVEQTCAQVARWRRELGAAAPRTAYVNLTARELADPALVPTISAALREHGLEPEHLGLELLESSFIDPNVLPALQEQHRRGHPLSVDDFGTGYSSLSRLVELPVRMAKIDKSLTTGIEHDARSRALVGAVVTVADSLDLQVIAEGVETAAQARCASDAGCHYLQGFHVGRPQSADALTAAWGA
ncbi:putative bifunctional diguanylate cyclase/phosphodiesterase [Kineococcus indalonis]|uniref:putative bifunctional diguanylate cyclase/phosphodiesterase n=1 Tax=Kineococcus indalonis TaxID=2696566 RepID=UPI001411F9D4|nr:EAL domain-containing protein [Kineococcus indalonis]NAZ86684.1 EAL domain-containing protein [Kineococcus indalonis]